MPEPKAIVCRHCDSPIKPFTSEGRTIWFDTQDGPPLAACPERGVGLHHEPATSAGGPTMPEPTTCTADDQQARTKWAQFSATNHAVRSGWATYHARPILRPWWRLRCRLGHHVQPTRSRGGYGRCPRCSAHLKWFLIGQHRYGGVDNGSSGGAG